MVPVHVVVLAEQDEALVHSEVPRPIVSSLLSQDLKQAVSYSNFGLQPLLATMPFSVKMTAFAHCDNLIVPRSSSPARPSASWGPDCAQPPFSNYVYNMARNKPRSNVNVRLGQVSGVNVFSWLLGIIIMMSDQFTGSRVEKRQQQTQPTLQYVSEYDSYGYLPPAASQTQLNQSSAVRTAYHLNPNGISNYQTVNTASFNTASRVKSQTNRLVSSQVKNENIVKGQSRVSYVPYQKKVVEYEDRTYVEKVPVKRKVVRYEQRKVMETVPREVITQDFYAVQKRIQYYKEVVPERKIEMVPVEKKIKRYEYVPVEKQIVHYPENVDLETAKGQSRVVLRDQGVEVRADAEFRPINPALIYNYSARPESKYNPIGYVDQGQSRAFSNSPTFLPQSYSQQIPDSDYIFYGQPSYSRTNSAQKLETNRMFSPRQAEGESYIKELSSIGKSQLKRPFQLLEQSKARNLGSQGNYGHLQGFQHQQSEPQQ